MTPTLEQTAIIAAACDSTNSILISALAGAAKTTTLELICKALPVQPILSLAFNKRIAEEMTKRLPGHVKCQTLNSLGHGVWAKACASRLVLNKDKTYDILKKLIDDLPRSQRSEAYDYFSTIRKAIGKAKLSGYVPKGKYPNAKRLIEVLPEDDEDDDLNGFSWLIDAALTESIRQAYAGLIDFDDQIYMPTLFGGTFPRFPLVLVDEAQDLSNLNHAMLQKLVTSRIIAVGDKLQSIYGFRGAAQNGMARLQSHFNMREMGLSVSFRCPRAVVRNAHWRAPHMAWPEWAKEGQVETLEQWGPAALPDGCAIICRNNAPLFSLALRLLRSGRGVQLVGFDIGPSLVRALKKLGPEHMNQVEVLMAITEWEEEALKKKKKKGSVVDRAECLRVFAYNGDTLAAAIAYAESLFKSSGPVSLLSGHKAKGLEWPVVFHLDPHRIPSPYAEGAEEMEQELNVRYVIETRAKESLFLVTMEGFNANV